MQEFHTDNSGRIVVRSLFKRKTAWKSTRDVERLVEAYRVHKNTFASVSLCDLAYTIAESSGHDIVALHDGFG